MTKQYTPVPVAAAKEIAEKFSKAIVIINTWDTEHGLLHTTTYGVSEVQKHQAAKGGDIAAKALGADMPRANFYEDFRKEIVICAAIKYDNGVIVRGHRHADCYHTGLRMRIGKDINGEQGFITSTNRFVSREEGRKLQDAAGIKSVDPEGYRGTTLFSEDLY